MFDRRKWLQNWRKLHPEKVKAYAHKSYLKNKVQRYINWKIWLDNNPWLKHLRYAKKRCYYPKQVQYKNYGGKGIRVKLTTPQIKILWIRDKASALKQPSLDRINSKGHYSMTNCRFIELSENRRRCSYPTSRIP